MDYELDDIDYEDMDDLALPDHIDWNQDLFEEFSIDLMSDENGYQYE